VNTQLQRVDGITTNARSVTGNVSALTSLFTATMGGPLVKTAAFSYGVVQGDQGAPGQQGRRDAGPGGAEARSNEAAVLLARPRGGHRGDRHPQGRRGPRSGSPPAGVGEQVGEGLRELAAAIGSFGAEVRAGMAEREHELTDMVEQRTGLPLPGLSRQPSAGRAPGAGESGLASTLPPTPCRRRGPGRSATCVPAWATPLGNRVALPH